MGRRDIVVIGASAGGAEALRDLCIGLPADLDAAIFVVWHIPAYSLGMLPAIIQSVSKLPVANAVDRQAVQRGQITVAPPDHHMLLDDGHVRLTQGPKENRFRPAIDPLFRSAAHSYGSRVIGIVLSGGMDDGSSGLWAVKDMGGIAVVQDPAEAMFPGMPQSALRNVDVDYTLSVSAMAELLVRLVNEPAVEQTTPSPGRLAIEVGSAAMARTDEDLMAKLGEVSRFTCPECHGSLWRILEGRLVRFRCRTGHAYSADVLLDELIQSNERSLWESVRTLEETADLLEHLGDHMKQIEHNGIGEAYAARAKEAVARAKAVRAIMEAKPA